MIMETAVRTDGRSDEQGLLFETAAKVLLWAAFFELVLYRLVSRLGMHLSKLAAKYESVRIMFKVLSSMGFTLLKLGSVVYNSVFWAILCLLVADYLSVPRPWSQRIMIVVYLLGISGWLYYQVVSTTYGLA